jgi:uncharacterized integral membrane protein
MLRLVCFILIFGVFLTFIGLNLENFCNVNFRFYAFSEVPVYITSLVSFVLGMLCAIPIILSKKEKKQRVLKEKEKGEKKNKKAEAEQNEISGEIGPYGIN